MLTRGLPYAGDPVEGSVGEGWIMMVAIERGDQLVACGTAGRLTSAGRLGLVLKPG